MFGLFRKKKKKAKQVDVPVQETVETEVEAPVEEPKEEPVVAKPVEETPVVEEAPVDETPVEEAPVKEDTPEEKVTEKAAPVKKARKLPYHITKHSDGGWQIKRAKAKKALRRFDTQQEAIEFAKVLEKEKGESYIIHKADGTTRKKTY